MSVRSLMARLGLAFGLVGPMAATAHAAPLEKAPATWVAYAKNATVSIDSWLNGNAPPAPRMREGMTRLRPQTDQLVPPLVLKVWVSPSGTISRVDSKSSGNDQADADLRTVLVGRNLGAPPRAMLQPLRLAIQLQEAKADAAKPGLEK